MGGVTGLLEDRKKKLNQATIHKEFLDELRRLKEVLDGVERWLSEQKAPEKDVEEMEEMLNQCRARQKEFNIHGTRYQNLNSLAREVMSHESTLSRSTQRDLKSIRQGWEESRQNLEDREIELVAALESAPYQHFQEGLQALMGWLEKVGIVLKSQEFFVTELEQLESQLDEFKKLQTDIKAQERNYSYIGQRGKDLMVKTPNKSDAIQNDLDKLHRTWNNVTRSAEENEDKVKTAVKELTAWQEELSSLKTWMTQVDHFLNVEEAAIGEQQLLLVQLEQCENLEHDIKTLQTNMDNLIETGEQLIKESTPLFAGYLEEELREIKENWEDIKVLAKKQEAAVQDAQEKTNKYQTESKEFTEYLEEMAKDFGKDFQVESEEEIQIELKRIQNALQELDGKKSSLDSIQEAANVITEKSSATLTEKIIKDIEDGRQRWQTLIDNLKAREKNLNEGSANWTKFLSLLQEEMTWMSEFEKELSNPSTSLDAEELSEEIDVLESSSQKHTVDRKKKIKELAETLVAAMVMSGRVEKDSKAFFDKIDDITTKAKARQETLEQNVQLLQSLEKDMLSLQNWISATERSLNNRCPTEYQLLTCQMNMRKTISPCCVISHLKTDLASREVDFKNIKERANVLMGQTDSSATQRMHQQVQLLRTNLDEVQLKFRKFQKPADFDPKMLHVKDILQNVEDGISVLDIKNSEPEVIQTQLDACMGFYKTLSEIKPEVEYVIKTGRTIVEKRQTDNPADLTDRLNHLKQMYNVLGKRVTEGKTECDKALRLSRKIKKEVNGFRELTENIKGDIKKKQKDGPVPLSLNQEMEWCKSMESEGKKKLNGVEDAKKMVEQLIKYSKEDCLEPMRGEIADWKEKVEEAMSEVAARKVIIK
ncbi:dystrophin-like protein, partial [Apostichopus japonicus]